MPIPVPPPDTVRLAPPATPRWTTPAAGGCSKNNGAGFAAGVGSKRTEFFFARQATPPSAQIQSPALVAPPICVPLATLSEHWPGVLRVEIEMLNLTQAQVALPAKAIEPALKRGRLVFTWRELRPWIQDAKVPVSVHDNIKLELPLKAVAPLFFARQKNGNGAKQVQVPEDIPNFFFDVTRPAETRTAPVPEAPVVPRLDTNRFPRVPDGGFQFSKSTPTAAAPGTAVPAKVVSRAMELPGVAGAIVALPDGLKVAGRTPPEVNSDTLAAFLPQIFTRVNQCSRELRMGEVGNLRFTVGDVPWAIFHTGTVYFAAFGRANEPIPTNRLAELATELDRKGL
jgi:hypothetical protein